jgi:hypothetical protein
MQPTIIPSTRYTARNLQAELDMIARHAAMAALNPLPTEKLARKHQAKQRAEKHRQIDQLALRKNQPRRPWLRNAVQPAALTILTFALWIGLGALAALAF